MADLSRLRALSIIAHVDHGKSTLADRILELTGAVDPKKMQAQLLDSMDLERERGITIKAQAVRVEYAAENGETYHLHLIDTPGHVDFSYEVSRSLAACEGALLVVDAAQGVEAQTVANTYLAIENGLELIPVINKVDLPGAEPERVAREIADLLGGDPEEALWISAKTGEGVAEVLEASVDLPWSMWAMMLKLRIWSMAGVGSMRDGARRAAGPVTAGDPPSTQLRGIVPPTAPPAGGAIYLHAAGSGSWLSSKTTVGGCRRRTLAPAFSVHLTEGGYAGLPGSTRSRVAIT